MRYNIYFLAFVAILITQANGVIIGASYLAQTNVPAESWSCLKKTYNMTSAMEYIYSDDGSVPQTARNINDARKGGFTNVDGWVLASVHNKKTSSQIYDSIFDYLSANGAKIDQIWLDVMNSGRFDQDHQVNINFINSLVTDGHKRGYVVGIKATIDSWSRMTGNTDKFSNVPLWFEPASPNHRIDDFANFPTFGG